MSRCRIKVDAKTKSCSLHCQLLMTDGGELRCLADWGYPYLMDWGTDPGWVMDPGPQCPGSGDYEIEIALWPPRDREEENNK